MTYTLTEEEYRKLKEIPRDQLKAACADFASNFVRSVAGPSNLESAIPRVTHVYQQLLEDTLRRFDFGELPAKSP